MIANLTAGEFEALAVAIDFYEVELQDQMETTADIRDYREARSRARALRSAFEKIRQLAPEVKEKR